MQAKSEIADIVAGEMNKQSKQFITELVKLIQNNRDQS